MIPLCAAPPASKLYRWRAMRAQTKCSSQAPRRPFSFRMYMASICQRATNWWPMDGALKRWQGSSARIFGADRLVYQDLDAMQQAVRDLNPLLARFEASCFDGQYVTGDITNEYLESLERMRSSPPDALQDWGL